jgi:DNA-binding Lrp family transcriptional regulator
MLDLLDKKIIVELDNDARQPLSRIARKLKASKHVISYRLSQLRKKGILNGFYAVVDTSRLGYQNYRLYLRFGNASLKRRERIIKSLVDDTATWWVAGTTYPWDAAVIFLAKSVAEANAKLRKTLASSSSEIADYSLQRYVKIVHFPKDYLVGLDPLQKRKSFTFGEGEELPVSPLERKLLLELSYDARAGTVQLAKKLGTTPAVVKYAIRKMASEGTILGFRVLVDYEKIGYDYYWIHVDSPKDDGELAAFARALPSTVYFDETLGGHSVEFAVHMKKGESMHGLMETMLEKFGEAISGYSYFRVVENHKVVYMPQLP